MKELHLKLFGTMAVRITCIKRDDGFHENHYTAITDLGWANEASGAKGLSTRLQIYEFIVSGGEAYVASAQGGKIKVTIGETAKGTKYVKTHPDESVDDDLLFLPQC